MGSLPPRHPGLVWVDPAKERDSLIVGKVPIAGVGLRVGMMVDQKLVHMSPTKARRMALAFEAPEAVEADLGWVAHALRECADEIEAAQAVKQ